MLGISQKLTRSFRPWLSPIEVTLSEQFAYGHRETLLKSLALPLDLLILGELQHGLATHPSEVPQSRARLRNRRGELFPFYVWSNGLRERCIQELGMRKVYSIGSPWAHFVASQNKELSLNSNSNQKSLYFPSHSFHGSRPVDNFENSINVIKSFISLDNLKACLYWLDFINPKVRERYEKLNIEITCLGYRGSSTYDFPWADVGGRVDFVENLYRTLINTELVFCDDISTAFWAACSLKKAVCVTSSEIKINSIWSNRLSQQSWSNEQALKWADNTLQLKVGDVVETSSRLSEVARFHFGWPNLEKTINVLKFKESKTLQESL